MVRIREVIFIKYAIGVLILEVSRLIAVTIIRRLVGVLGVRLIAPRLTINRQPRLIVKLIAISSTNRD